MAAHTLGYPLSEQPSLIVTPSTETSSGGGYRDDTHALAEVGRGFGQSSHPVPKIRAQPRPSAVLQGVNETVGGRGQDGGGMSTDELGRPLVTLAAKTIPREPRPSWSATAKASGVRQRLEPESAPLAHP